MLSRLIIVVALALGSHLAFSKRLAASSNWKATVTPLVAAQQHPSVLSKVEISAVIICIAAFTGFLFSFATPLSVW